MNIVEAVIERVPLLSHLFESKPKQVAGQIFAEDIDAAAANLADDTKGDPDLLIRALDHTNELRSRLNYGILRCDYEYTPTRGDPGAASSFRSGAVALKVEGWTFEAVQRGLSNGGGYPVSEFRLKKADGTVDEYWAKLWEAFPDGRGTGANRSGYRRVTEKVRGDRCTEGYFSEEDYSKGEVYRYDPDVIELKMKETILKLEESGVCGISADVGYSQAFQNSVKRLTSLPVMLSSLQQLSIVAPMFDVRPEKKNKIMVMTANSVSFDVEKLIPPGVDRDCIHVVGMEKSVFGKWVAGGNSFSRFKTDAFDAASVEEGLESMCDECQHGIKTVERDGSKVVCIVQECAEMPAYSNGLRRRFKLPVYDTMTAISFVQTGWGPGFSASYMM